MTTSDVRESRKILMQRLLLALLAVVVLSSMFLLYAEGIHSKTDEAVAFSGLDFLRGLPDGKSNGVPNILLLPAFAAAIALVFVCLFNKDNTFFPILLSILTAGCVWLFRFDVIYSAKAEFNLTADLVRFDVGWILAACASLLAVAVSISYKATVGFALRKRKLAETFASANLPNGYRVRSVGEIIVSDFKKHWFVYLLILPTIVYYLVWCYGPMYGIVIAFNDYAPKKGFLGSKWVGMRWFREFFRSPFAFRVIRNTLMISFYNLLIGFPAPIIMALMLNEMQNIKAKRTIQTITYMPYFISLVVLCGILVDFTSTDGVFGEIFKLFGMEPVNLLGDASYFRSVYIGSELWQKLGWDTIIFLSALSGIDPALYEAATIDGAGKFKQVLHVTIPGIMPTIAILLILRMGAMMSVGYEKIILIYNGLNYETSDVISTYVYRKGIVDADFSFSTAVNLFNSIINFLLVVFANKISGLLTETSLW